ncbi:hypothetical protein N7488_009070 [Penicillium malachiteum]|nr:hypothetical protein N7488_009070 [Penicillium malachiteum]
MEFARWKSSTHAETLFVQGNLPMVGSERITAMSAVGATLYLTISKNTDAIVLFFPCGLHEGAMDPISGPNGLIRSLIAQILLQRNNTSLDFIDNRLFAEAIQSHSLSALLALLVALIERLPQTVKVVMILDGLVRFESRPWRRDLSDIIQTLNNLLCKKYLRPVVKLLVTSPYANPGKVEKMLSPCQVLRLRRTGARHGHRLSEMNRYLDDSMREPGQDASEIDSSSSDSNDLEETEDMTDDDTESDDEDEEDDESDD